MLAKWTSKQMSLRTYAISAADQQKACIFYIVMEDEEAILVGHG